MTPNCRLCGKTMTPRQDTNAETHGVCGVCMAKITLEDLYREMEREQAEIEALRGRV